ncbi:MAG: histidine phosphatase family protein [Bacteroidota bacterium]
MKTLFFIRHAKSSWDDPGLRDHDRPLNARGIRDAPRMANRLLGMDITPDGILTSSAKRAQQTAAYFRDALNVAPENVIVAQELYHAWPEVIAEHVRQLPDAWNTVLVFGHNPGYTALTNLLRNDLYIGNVPTCGISGAKATINSWSAFTFEDASRFAYLYPKQV